MCLKSTIKDSPVWLGIESSSIEWLPGIIEGGEITNIAAKIPFNGVKSLLLIFRARDSLAIGISLLGPPGF